MDECGGEAKATASLQRVVTIRRQLEELRALRTRLQEFGPDPRKWQKFLRKYEAQKATVRAGKKGRAVHFPGGRGDTEGRPYKRLYSQTEGLHSAVNEALCRYAFRPRVTYFVASEIWRGGMVPDDNSRWFQMRMDHQTTISEADAVLSLVRLDLAGEIEKVALCQVCRNRWYVQAKRNYRFCGSAAANRSM